MFFSGVKILKGSCSDVHDVQYVFRHHPDITDVIHAISNDESDPMRAVGSNIESLVNVLEVISKRDDTVSLRNRDYNRHCFFLIAVFYYFSLPFSPPPLFSVFFSCAFCVYLII